MLVASKFAYAKPVRMTDDHGWLKTSQVHPCQKHILLHKGAGQSERMGYAVCQSRMPAMLWQLPHESQQRRQSHGQDQAHGSTVYAPEGCKDLDIRFVAAV